MTGTAGRVCIIGAGSSGITTAQMLAAKGRRQIAACDAAIRKRYVASKRHTIQVDVHTYRGELRRESRTRRV